MTKEDTFTDVAHTIIKSLGDELKRVNRLLQDSLKAHIRVLSNHEALLDIIDSYSEVLPVSMCEEIIEIVGE